MIIVKHSLFLHPYHMNIEITKHVTLYQKFKAKLILLHFKSSQRGGGGNEDELDQLDDNEPKRLSTTYIDLRETLIDSNMHTET